MNEQEAIQRLSELAGQIPEAEARRTIEEIKTLIGTLATQTDSIELGSGTKGGKVKVYFNASEPVDAKAKIKHAVGLLAEARTEYTTRTGVEL